MGTVIKGEFGLNEAVRVLINGEETLGSLAMIEQRIGRETITPRHIHTHEDEIIYVLAGHLTFTVGDRAVDALAGSCVILPRNVEHSYQVISDEARLLVIVTPAGLEGYFREVGTPTPPEVERMVTIAARYGVTITGPAV